MPTRLFCCPEQAHWRWGRRTVSELCIAYMSDCALQVWRYDPIYIHLGLTLSWACYSGEKPLCYLPSPWSRFPPSHLWSSVDYTICLSDSSPTPSKRSPMLNYMLLCSHGSLTYNNRSTKSKWWEAKQVSLRHMAQYIMNGQEDQHRSPSYSEKDESCSLS